MYFLGKKYLLNNPFNWMYALSVHTFSEETRPFINSLTLSHQIKGNRCTFREGNNTKDITVPFSKRFFSESKEYASMENFKGSKFFPFRVDPFSKGDSCAGMKSHKSCLPYKNCRAQLFKASLA